jgi:ethanolamine utilization protein EutQ
MKVLITADEVKNRAARGEKRVLVNQQAIVTPAARDMAREIGLTIVCTEEECTQVSPIYSSVKQKLAGGEIAVSPELVERIVREVLVMLGNGKQEPTVEKHHTGVRLVHGETVIGDPFQTGNPRDKVTLKDALPLTDSPNMCAGFIEIEKSAFEWELKYDEYDYVIDGELEIVVDGQAYRGVPGDIFFIPKGTRITFSSPGKTKFFYVTYPANWREQV